MNGNNIDLLKFANIFSYGYLPNITNSARVSKLSATIIDHIYVDDKASIIHQNNITDMSDHV